MDLLTQAERDEAREALHDTTDTFCKTPVVFKKKLQSRDRWGNGTDIEYSEITAFFYVWYPQLEINDGLASTSGISEPFDIKMMINTEEAIVHGFFKLPNTVNLAVGELFIVDGESYKIEDWNTDGNFEHRSILLFISGVKLAK